MNLSSSENLLGVSFTGLLTLMFIFLKLWGKIDWSWWWVLSPIWIPALLVLVIIAIIATILYFRTRNK